MKGTAAAVPRLMTPRETLDIAAIIIALLAAIAGGWFVVRSKAAEVWKDVAEARQLDEYQLLIAELKERVVTLSAKVTDLEKRDQEAVLNVLERHERRAQERHDAQLAALERIAHAIEGGVTA